MSSFIVSAKSTPQHLHLHNGSASLSMIASSAEVADYPPRRNQFSFRWRWTHVTSCLHVKRSATKTGVAPITFAVRPDPLKVMISGAPASGKGTQSELIIKKHGLVHIAAGDLLREEITAGNESGRRAKAYMEKGQLVPDEIIVTSVVGRVFQQDAQQNGWLFDGYPRSLSQAQALKELAIQPDIFIELDVSEEILVERVVGRRLDPVTGKIYHLKCSPPETKEIAARLIRRFDDTEEKVKLRMQTYHQNVEDLLSAYKDVLFKVNGNLPKEDVFEEIDSALVGVLEKKAKSSSLLVAVDV